VSPQHPLEGIEAKLARATAIIDEIEVEAAVFYASVPRPVRIESGFLSDPRKFEFRGTAICSPPLHLALLAGEVTHHLRSCYDHLVVQLANLTGQEATRQHQFPIADKRAAFESAVGRDYLKGVPAAAVDKIAALQPYHLEKPSTSTLWVISDLNNQDKHRLPILVSQAAAVLPSVKIGSSTENAEITHLGMPGPHFIGVDPTELFSVTITRPIPDFRVELSFDFQIAFGALDAGVALPVPGTLRRMRDFTIKVMNDFRPMFEVR
jgi:hypothetical protein